LEVAAALQTSVDREKHFSYAVALEAIAFALGLEKAAASRVKTGC
jgi:hypothetical protein